MAESVDRCDEVILGRCSGIAHDKTVKDVIVRVGKENGFYVGVIDADMAHAILLLVASCELVAFDDSVPIVRLMGTEHYPILCLLYSAICGQA